MADKTATIALAGEVRLSDFATAVTHFRSLLDALQSEVAEGTTIDWVVTGLEVSSAMATVTGWVADTDAEPRVIDVVRAYDRVGKALERRERTPFSARVEREAVALASIVNGHVENIRFETAESEAIVTSLPTATAPVSIDTSALSFPVTAYGAVEGRVQALSNRGSLHFTLYDTLNDKAVSCYLAEGSEEVMRDAWGRLAVVEGWVRRDSTTGRPLTIREVADVNVVAEGAPEGYREARGSVARGNGLRAEEIIRLLRDA